MSKSANIIECTLCLNTYINPKVLPCVHTFCLKCLEKYGKDCDPCETLSCPLCRTEFVIPSVGLADLPNNYFVKKRLEIDCITSIMHGEKLACEICTDEDESDDDNESGKNCRKNGEEKKEKIKHVAQVYCLECQQHMCVRCQKGHDKMRFNRAHTVIQPGKDKSEGFLKMTSSLCDRHADEPFKYFCLDCSIIICLSCYVEGHSTHKCSNIGKEAEATRIRLQENVDRLVEQSNKLLPVAKELETEEKSLNKKVSDTCDAIEKRLEEAKRILDSQAKELKAEVQAIKNIKMKEIDAAKELNSRHQLMMNTFTGYTQEVKDQATDSELLRCAKILEARAAELKAVVRTASGFSAIKIEFTPQAGHLGEIRTKKCNTFMTDSLQLYKTKPKPSLIVIPGPSLNILTITALRNEIFMIANTTCNDAFGGLNQQLASRFVIYVSTTTPVDISAMFPAMPYYDQYRTTCLQLSVTLSYQVKDVPTISLIVSDAQGACGSYGNHPCVTQVAYGNFFSFISSLNKDPDIDTVKIRLQDMEVSITIDLALIYSATSLAVSASNLQISEDATAPASVEILKEVPGISSSLPVVIFDLNCRRHRQVTYYLVASAAVTVCEVASCSYYNRAYVSDKANSLIHLLDSNSDEKRFSASHQWKIAAPPNGLSVTAHCNVVVATNDNRIFELSPADGKQLREIVLDGITDLQRAIRLTDSSDLEDKDEFIFMHGPTNGPTNFNFLPPEMHGSYTLQLVQATGEKKTFPKVDANLLLTAVDVTFDDTKECVFILSQDKKITVVNMKSANVENSRELISLSDHSLQGSNRMYLDKDNGRLFVWTSGSTAAPGVFDVTTENLDDELMKSIKT